MKKWFVCPDGKTIGILDCLKDGGCRMKPRCASRPYLQLAGSEREWTGKPSTTQLIIGTNEAFLKLTKDYGVSPDDQAFAINGTNAHANLEKSKDNLSMQEEIFGDSDISGIADVIEREDGEVRLLDYKTCGSYKVAKALGIVKVEYKTSVKYKTGKRAGQFKTYSKIETHEDKIDNFDWDMQLNKYRIEYESKYKEKVTHVIIQSIVRDGSTYIATNRGIDHNVYMIPIKILDDWGVLEYFDNKKRALLEALETGKCDSICNDRECWDGRKCSKYCNVRQYCKGREEEF